MKERVTKFISVLFITSSLLVALFPFSFVFADVLNYVDVPTSKTNISGQYYWNESSGASGVRAVCLYDGNSYFTYFVRQGSKGYVTIYYPGSYANMGYRTYLNGYYVGNNDNSYIENANWNIAFKDKFGYVNATHTNENAIYYTFGPGSVSPDPTPTPTPIVYGDLIIDGYNTDIAGQGEASINNIDHIKWNGYLDSNGNDISNCKVRLQIVPGKYTGTSKSDLSNKTRQDFVIDPINASDSLFDATVGEVSLSWRDIVNRIDIIPYRLYSLELFGTDWQKDGWIYKLRLEDEDNDYIGEWQTVYSSTSNGVQNDLNITNITTINQTLIQSFQELNSINNVENNWTYNNTEISVENNYSEPSLGEKPWWAYLLESILNTFNITNNYIYEGDSNTQNITNTVNDSDDDMNSKIGEYQQFEDNFIDDMDTNLTDIDTDIDFLSDNKFIASANWVAQQYNRMTNNTVIGSFIGFSLLFGLALIFIGKIR